VGWGSLDGEKNYTLPQNKRCSSNIRDLSKV